MVCQYAAKIAFLKLSKLHVGRSCPGCKRPPWKSVVYLFGNFDFQTDDLLNGIKLNKPHQGKCKANVQTGVVKDLRFTDQRAVASRTLQE